MATTIRPPITLEGDWRDRLICDDKGKLVKSSLTNAMLFIQNHESLAGVFRLNDFQKEIYVARFPMWENEETFKVHRITDTDITNCSGLLENYGVTCEPSKAIKAIASVAEKNGFHPARDYFDALVWDGKERLCNWLSYYMGAEDDALKYLSFIGTKWLTAAVKRVYKPGCKFDHVLVMEGRQGKGKSTALEYMATFGDEEEAYFTDNIKISDIQNKDTILLLQGSIIAELAELAGFNKKDDEEIKGWVTLKVDRCRKPYDRTITVFPRQFVLAATTNSYDYLKDPTGNRRYWPFKSSSVDLDAIKRDRQQLWAEAVHWYKSGLYIGPTEEEMALAETAQEKRRTIDTWEDDVLRAAKKLNTGTFKGFSTTHVFEELNIAFKDRDYKATRRITAILQQAGYVSKSKWMDGKTTRVWVEKDEIV
jgi:predicted P-loop ATPase